MRKEKKAILCITLLITLAIATAPVFAKNLNLPNGADWIEYYNAGGLADILLPTPLPAGFPSSATAMELRFVHVEMPNSEVTFDYLLVFIYAIQQGTTAPVWIPFAVVTTSDDAAAQAATFWSGTPIKLDATLYTVPPYNVPPAIAPLMSSNNIFVVPEGELTVERHGNDVTVNLNIPQSIKRPLTYPPAYITLPAFSLELQKYGGSIHSHTSGTLTGWLGASGCTTVHDEMGFNANGVFTSPDSALNGAPVQNATLWMHGSHTFYPP